MMGAWRMMNRYTQAMPRKASTMSEVGWKAKQSAVTRLTKIR